MSASAACPVCGHSNPPDARFCARCGTQLDRILGAEPSGGPALPPPPPGPVTITHRGNAYAIGYGDTFYGVWNVRGGSPLERFERTEVGWQLAWAHFQQLESQGGGKGKLFHRGS